MIMSSMHLKIGHKYLCSLPIEIRSKNYENSSQLQILFFYDKNDINGYYIFTLDWQNFANIIWYWSDQNVNTTFDTWAFHDTYTIRIHDSSSSFKGDGQIP